MGSPDTIQSKNECLHKKNAGVCKIGKGLNIHITRDTFAENVMLKNSFLIESVSKKLCRKNFRTTQHYAKVLDRKVSEDMKVLKHKFFNNSKNINII
ncbi:tyrosine-type recombinase/integrase [Yeosuana sp.]|uniref:tyrosine-type recombinase/integrase n=1 Tax=Yeosuana sp. TaxID=2529388 RepID=UPI00404A2470